MHQTSKTLRPLVLVMPDVNNYHFKASFIRNERLLVYTAAHATNEIGSYIPYDDGKLERMKTFRIPNESFI
jgi:hypothetical protein